MGGACVEVCGVDGLVEFIGFVDVDFWMPCMPPCAFSQRVVSMRRYTLKQGGVLSMESASMWFW